MNPSSSCQAYYYDWINKYKQLTTMSSKNEFEDCSRQYLRCMILSFLCFINISEATNLGSRMHHHAFIPNTHQMMLPKRCSSSRCYPISKTTHASKRNASIRDDIISLISKISDKKEVNDDDDDDDDPPSSQPQPQVYIIGTGISPKILDLPLSTLIILSRADIILHDALSLPRTEIAKITPESCIIVNVGKRGDKSIKSMKQNDIDSLLLKYAVEKKMESDDDGVVDDDDKSIAVKKYPTIVRLKGGDPFVFGRTRTEIDILRNNSISYKVIPNLSSCVAGPHVGGIPLTDPLIPSDSFAVFSGTNAAGEGLSSSDDGRDWDKMTVDSLIFLMMGRIDKLDDFCKMLGQTKRWGEDTYCAIVQNAGRESQQRVWRATLGDLVDVIRKDLGSEVVSVSPAVFIVGEIASLNLLPEKE